MVGSRDFYGFHDQYTQAGARGETHSRTEVEEIYFPSFGTLATALLASSA